MKATQPSPKQRSDDERGGGEEGSGCASRPHAEPSPRAQGESTPAPPAESRGAGRSLHLLPPRGRAERGRRAEAERHPPTSPGPPNPALSFRSQSAHRSPHPGPGTAGGARAGPPPRGAGWGGGWPCSARGRRRESAPRAARVEGPPPALTCPLAPSRSGATLRPGPTVRLNQAPGGGGGGGGGGGRTGGAGRLPETAPPPRHNPAPPAPGPAPGPPPPSPIGPRLGRMGAAPPCRPQPFLSGSAQPLGLLAAGPERLAWPPPASGP
ncbi:translation initiation factor IF-2-like [Phacochoerus africanus]|uniref:translation initiation factor IF-2-like n=1 Tax=Phacochoerus africanus TaxID=41426 RepID=UPI001FDAA4AF|nr:translation initiation factor IF-2-like [Phacochoerus africanus]